MKCLLGLYDVDNGEIFFDEKKYDKDNISNMSNLRKQIGMVFQGSALFDSMTVLDNIMFPLRMFSAKTESEMISRAKEVIKRVDLKDSNDSIRLMTIGNTGGWRNFANTKRRVANPSDMKGLKIRTVVADLPQELVRALGASPTPIPWPELFTSFQTGVVEGSKNGITDIMNMKFPDAGLKYVTLDGHAYMGALWWMNNAKYESMSPDLKKVVTDGFYALQQATFASPKRKSIKAYEDFVAGGGDLYVPTPDQKASFKKEASPVYDWFKANVKGGKEIFNALTKAVASAEKRASSAYKKDL